MAFPSGYCSYFSHELDAAEARQGKVVSNSNSNNNNSGESKAETKIRTRQLLWSQV